jgi:hypothetical protein
VTLRNSNQTIDDGEVRRKFQQFGDVKSVRSAGERHELVSVLRDGTRELIRSVTSQRYVEFYDTRVSNLFIIVVTWI